MRWRNTCPHSSNQMRYEVWNNCKLFNSFDEHFRREFGKFIKEPPHFHCFNNKKSLSFLYIFHLKYGTKFLERVEKFSISLFYNSSDDCYSCRIKNSNLMFLLCTLYASIETNMFIVPWPLSVRFD